MTLYETLPKRKSLEALNPLLPTTIVSAFSLFAIRKISSAASFPLVFRISTSVDNIFLARIRYFCSISAFSCSTSLEIEYKYVLLNHYLNHHYYDYIVPVLLQSRLHSPVYDARERPYYDIHLKILLHGFVLGFLQRPSDLMLLALLLLQDREQLR